MYKLLYIPEAKYIKIPRFSWITSADGDYCFDCVYEPEGMIISLWHSYSYPNYTSEICKQIVEFNGLADKVILKEHFEIVEVNDENS